MSNVLIFLVCLFSQLAMGQNRDAFLQWAKDNKRYFYLGVNFNDSRDAQGFYEGMRQTKEYATPMAEPDNSRNPFEFSKENRFLTKDDAKFLSFFPSLESIDLTLFPIDHVPDFSIFKRLKSLKLLAVQTNHFDPIFEVPTLQHLGLYVNPGSLSMILDGLKGLKELTSLELGVMRKAEGLNDDELSTIEDSELDAIIDALKKNRNITSLTLSNAIDQTQVDKIAALIWLKEISIGNFATLGAHSTERPKIRNLEALGKIENLETLRLRTEEVLKLGSLEKLPNLRALTFSGVKFSLEPMVTLKKLESLRLEMFFTSERSQKGTSFGEVFRVPVLKTLHTTSTDIRNFDGLENSKNLRSIDSGACSRCSLEVLENLENLEVLDLRRGLVGKLPDFRKMLQLRELRFDDLALGSIGAKDLQDISFLTNLEVLCIGRPQSFSDDDLRILSPLTKLRSLYLYNDFVLEEQGEKKIADVSDRIITGRGIPHLAALKNLEFLDLDANRVQTVHLKSLEQFEKLAHLRIWNNSLSAESFVENFPRLKSLRYVYLSENPNITPKMKQQLVEVYKTELAVDLIVY